MKLRHAAALALVGWYLMMPPSDGHSIDRNAPLDKWEVYSGYDTAKECEEGKIDQRALLRLRPTKPAKQWQRSL
jgi:hypothetical protein